MNKLQVAKYMVKRYREYGDGGSIYYSEEYDDFHCSTINYHYGYDKILECPIDEFGALHPGDATDAELILWIAKELIPNALENKK